MRRVLRQDLDDKSGDFLDKWAVAARSARPPLDAAGARKDWNKRRSNTKTMRNVVATLREMNGAAASRCMYCEDNEAGHIDHFEPLAGEPAGVFDWNNMVLACDICDTVYKKAQFLSLRGLRPLDPTTEAPSPHLRQLSTGALEGLTGRGRWTIDMLGLNKRQTLTHGRCDRWLVLATYIEKYAEAVRAGDTANAQRYRRAVQRGPFLSMLPHILAAAQSRAAHPLNLTAVGAAVIDHPQIRGWA